MKYIRQFFSVVKSVLGAACSPVWNHARILRAVSNVLFGIAFLSITALVFGWIGQRPIFIRSVGLVIVWTLYWGYMLGIVCII